MSIDKAKIKLIMVNYVFIKGRIRSMYVDPDQCLWPSAMEIGHCRADARCYFGQRKFLKQTKTVCVIWHAYKYSGDRYS